MSIDITLVSICEYCHYVDEILSMNITHNLVPMAKYLKIYDLLWKSKPNIKALKLVVPLQNALVIMRMNPDTTKSYEPENKWGTYEELRDKLDILKSCCEHYPESNFNSYS